MSDKSEDQQKPSSSSSDNNSGMASGSELINIIVKTSKERETFQIAPDASIKTLRELVSERYKVDPPKVCLIFSGKILKDGDTLENHKMKDGYIVHLVIRDVSKPSNNGSSSANATSTTNTTTTSTNTNPTSNTGTGTGTTTNNPTNELLGNLLGMFVNNDSSNPNLEDLDRQFGQQMNNPEFIQQALNNPLMQNFYTNPELFRSFIINANPELQQLIDRNPEINHMISNPDMLRHAFDMIRNPAALQELMRSHDRAMSNLESLPGGYNALRRMYTELQEPMLNAAQEQFGVNPFATSSDSNPVSTTPSNTENREPLPNPWQRSGGGNNSTPGANSTNTTNTNRNLPFNLFGSNAFQQMLNQMYENPNVLQTLLNSPLMQNMVMNFANNPQLSSQIFEDFSAGLGATANAGSTPGAAANTTGGESNQTGSGNTDGGTGGGGAGQQAINSMNPLFDVFANLTSPQFQRLMSDPQARQAISQILQGYAQLDRILRETRNLTPSSESTTESSSSSSTVTSSNSSSISTTSTITTSTQQQPPSPSAPISTTPNINTNTNTTNAVPNIISNILPQLMQQMLQTNEQQQQQPPETRYATQLSQLEAMGFTNRELNLRILVETAGNFNAALDRLLRMS